VAATSLKLPDELKQRIVKIVAGSNRTSPAFMVEAIERAVKSEELRRRFGEEAALAEREADKSGRAYDAAEAFAYFENQMRGKRVRKPRLKVWQKSV
jgi:predicted transcriptional regulator